MKKGLLSRRGSSRSTKAGLMLAAAAASLALNRYAGAQITGTWVDTSVDSNWSEGVNWSTNPTPPGNDTGATTNGDTAFFNNSAAVANESTVNLDVANWNILNITFDSATGSNFIIGSTAAAANSLVLSSGGEINEDSSVSGTASDAFNGPVVLEGNYTFNNDSAVSACGLKFNGNVSGGVSGPIALTLSGANHGSTTGSNDQIIGALTNGSSSALSVVKTGAGIWELSSTSQSTYTGTTSVNGGILTVTTGDGISPYTDVIVNNSGTSTFSNNVSTGPFPTIHSLTVTAGTQGATSSTTAMLNITNNIGPALFINSQGNSLGATPVSLNFDLTGSGGIIDLQNQAYNTHSTFEGTGKTIDLGTTSHLWYANAGNTTTDVQINGFVASDSSGGGIIKSGNGTYKFEQNSGAILSESFTGPIEIQEGSLKLTGQVNYELTGLNALLVDGGNFNVDGTGAGTGDVTVASFNATGGSISNGSANYLFAPSYNFNMAAGTNFSVGGNFGDESAATINGVLVGGSATSAVTINGPGSVTLSGSVNNYTGGTTVSGGTLVANMNASGNPISTGSVALNGASLNLDPNVAAGSGGPISYGVANLAASTQLTYGGGDVLTVKQGNETSFTVTIGNASPSGNVLNRVNNGTLVIAPDLGTANLGIPAGTEFVFVNGMAATSLVNPSIVVQNNDANNDAGDFLSYSTANGFAVAAYSASTNINTAGAAAVYNAGTGSNNNTLSASAAVTALNAENQTINTNGSTLTVGGGSGQAGVILNGGTIGTSGALAFSGAEGTIFTSKAGGTISTTVSGSNGVTTFGAGTLTLSGSNTFTGGLNINQGTVDFTADSNLGAAGGTITLGGGTLQLTGVSSLTESRSITINAGNGTIDPQAGTLTISSPIGGSGNLTLGSPTSGGTIVVSGANSYAGTVINTPTTLQINAGGTLGTGTVVNNGALIFNSSGALSIANAISGSGSLNVGAGGTVVVSGTNSYSGATIVNNGTIRTGSANALGFGGASVGINTPIATATANSTGAIDLNGQTLNKPLTLNGGTLTNTSASTAGLLTGVGGYVVTSGGSGIEADLALTKGGGVTALSGNGATLKLLLGLTAASATVTTAGAYTNVPSVTITGGGGSGATATAILSGGTTGGLTGFTITNPGSGYFTTPSFSVSTTFATTAAAVAGNQFNFTAVGAQAISAGSGYTSVPTVSAPAIYDNATNAATGPTALVEVLPTVTAVLNTVNLQSTSSIGGNSGNISLAVPVTGGGGLIKTGSNTLTLSGGSNTYGGGTTVSSGTLDVSNTTGSATGTGNVTLNGGVLASDSGSISGSVIAGTGSHTIAPGGIGTIGTLSIGGLTSSNLTTINFDLGAGSVGAPTSATGDLLNLNGAVSIGSGTLLSLGGAGVIGDFYRLIGGTAVASPSAAAIIAAGFTVPAGYSLNTTIDPGFIDLTAGAAGPVSLSWDNAGGATPSDGRTWDISNNKNWNNGGSPNTVYTDGSNVTFNDTNNNGSNPNAYNVTLNTLVSPASVTVSTTGTYSITGTGTIGGTGSLTKSGTGTLSLATPNAYSGGTIVTAGKLLIGQAGTNATFSGPTLVSANTLTALPTGTLSVSGNGIAQLADGVTNQTFITPSAHSAVVTSNINLSSLSLTGSGTLDIGNNRIIIDYTTGHDPISSIKTWIANGFSDGETAGALPAIISSDVAADDTASGFSYGLGYADGADSAIAGLPSGEIEIMFTLLGDANLDGTVNSEDFTPFSNNLNGSGRSWDQGDFNYDGTVNSEDFTPFSHDLNQSASLSASETGALASPLVSAGGLSLTNVPEPASIGLMAIAGCSLLARRRRSSR